MKILFMGTPEFARVVLDALFLAGHTLVGAVTQPDKPQGRRRILTPPPVKEYALAHGIPVFQPTTLKDGAFAATLEATDPELIAVAAYGKILPGYVLDYPRFGCLNAHASLLPRWRGAAPIQRAILAGDTVTGVTAMRMAAGLDTGAMILQIPVPIGPDDTYAVLHDALAQAGGRALCEAIARLEAGTAQETEQNEEDATYAAKIENADCALDFARPVGEVYDRVRALSPSPAAAARMPDGRLLKIIAARAEKTDVRDAAPGTVVGTGASLDVACDGGILHVLTLQPEGKARMAAADFLRGRGLALGDRLTTPDFGA